MPISEEYYLGSRHYRCAGDWALPDKSTEIRESLSTSNLVGVIPANAIAVELRATAVLKAIGVADTSLVAGASVYGDTITAANFVDEQVFKIGEPDGLNAGDIVAQFPIHFVATITNNIVDPEFNMSCSLTAGSLLTDIAVIGYWLR